MHDPYDVMNWKTLSSVVEGNYMHEVFCVWWPEIKHTHFTPSPQLSNYIVHSRQTASVTKGLKSTLCLNVCASAPQSGLRPGKKHTVSHEGMRPLFFLGGGSSYAYIMPPTPSPLGKPSGNPREWRETRKRGDAGGLRDMRALMRNRYLFWGA